MRFSPKRTQSLAVIVACAVSVSAAIVLVIGYNIHQHVAADSASQLLRKADDFSWNDQWIAAEPLYRQAEQLFVRQGNFSKALYARVSQMPAQFEAGSLPSEISELTKALNLPGAQDSDTRLRILEILGRIETDYDAGMARKTWSEVETLAPSRFQFRLATRALGEEGIAAYILGDTTTAARKVRVAWIVAKVANDYAAHVRYASAYGVGLVDLHRYKEALAALDEAINTARAHPQVAYPSIAVASKIDALRGLQRYTDALALSQEALAHIPDPSLKGHYYQLFLSRANIYQDLNQWNTAIADLARALEYATQLEYWRGISEVGGQLAQAYDHQGDLDKALNTIDRAIDANKKIPDELYRVPRNLAIKAEIEAKIGKAQEAEDLYKKSTAIIDSLLQHVPTRNVERMLIGQLGDVYSGYFASACREHDYDKALRVLEEARGRIEAQALEHHDYIPVTDPTPEERRLTELNLELINSNDPKKRSELTKSIYDAELATDHRSLEALTISEPVALRDLQAHITDDELLVEYVLAEPHSYALAITRTSVHPYELDGKERIETDSQSFLNGIRKPQADARGGDALFDELLRPIPEYRAKPRVIVVPDGELNLLPFNALSDKAKFVVEDHTVTSSPSATVFAILRDRENVAFAHPLPYIGVAAWTHGTAHENPIFRSFAGPSNADLQPLPESRKEVEAIAADLPKPSTILLGGDATETHFKSLPLADFHVLHLALHGFVDTDYPDRSALVFAPSNDKTDDGMLQIREIRNLHLNARLVTLSACDTGVGPVGEDGVANIVNAFIEAGADSVVSTLWELEDHATEQLMEAFYANLSKGESKGDALRDAQRALLKEGYSPFYWASFELVGDPNGTI
jgi:CHAT domain-containing protein